MLEFLIGLSLLGYCLGITRWLRCRIEVTPLYVVTGIIIALYFSAYFNQLMVGTYTLLGIGWLLLAFSPFYLPHSIKLLFQDYLSCGFVITALGIGIFSALAGQHSFHLWDEFSHWGALLKQLFATHHFVTHETVIVHRDYPPAEQLWSYLFFSIGGYSERIAYVAQNILIMAPLALLLRNFDWKEWQQATLSLWVMILLLLIALKAEFGPSISIYMDTATGVYFGGIITAYLASRRTSPSILVLMIPIGALLLFKLKLLSLVLVILSIMMIDQFFFQKNSLLPLLKRIGSVLLVLLSSLLVAYSWNHYISINHIHTEWQLNLSMATINPEYLTIIKNFFYKLHSPGLMGLCLLSLGYFNYRLTRLSSIMALHSVLFIGLLSYLAGLLLMYLFRFKGIEATGLASFDRYSYIYLIGWTLVICNEMIYALRSITIRHARPIIIASFIALMSISTTLFLLYPRHDQDTEALAIDIASLSQPVIDQTPNNSKIFTVWQKSKGFPSTILQYQLMPRTRNLNCANVNPSLYHDENNNPWGCKMTSHQFLQKIRHFDYLLLAHVDTTFWHDYAALFHQMKPPIKPFIKYTLCDSPQFDGVKVAGCKPTVAQAYLFKIIKTGNQTKIVPVRQIR